MTSHDPPRVRVAELKARLSSFLKAARRGESITVYDRDTPVARLVPFDEARPSSLPVRKATRALRSVPLPPPLDRDLGSLSHLAEERQSQR